MRTPTPSFSVKVDATNPGQFFACCGLLELAHRRWRGAEGWFDNNRFNVCADAAPGTDIPQECLTWLRDSTFSRADDRGEKAIRAVQLVHADGLSLTLDWWIDWHGKKTALKLWAGNQTSIGILEMLRDGLPRAVSHDDLFDASEPLSGRFGVDPRAAWNALDVGFSPNEQQMDASTYPAVELLAAVGLQGFRPREDSEHACWRYATWNVPCSPPVARAASAAVIPAGEVHHYRFGIVARGSYKGFGFARPTGG
ncbi:MAG TPA: hypothetical protein VGQ19_02920 [Burkholderiales bacterium]|jgi:CRISPR-associated protein Csx14|nr:hypothetical protein [Burkholderiales bacterium]